MNVTVDRKKLETAMASVMRCIANNSTLPILQHVLFSADGDAKDGGKLAIKATDLDAFLSLMVDAEVKADGAITTKASPLYELVGSLAGDSIVLKTDTIKDSERESPVVRVSSGRSSYKLLTLSADEFPEFPDPFATGKSFTVGQAELKKAVRRAMKSVAGKKESNPAIQGVLFDCGKDGVSIVSTDNYRIMLTDFADSTLAGLKAIVPRNSMSQVFHLLGEDGDIGVFVDSNLLCVGFSVDTGARLVSRLIDSNFVNYRKALEGKAGLRVLRVNTNDMLAGVKRAMITGGVTSRVIIDVGKAEVHLHSESGEVGSMDDMIDGSLDGPPVKTACNGDYLKDVLEEIETETCILDLSDDVGGVCVLPADKSGFRSKIAYMDIASW